MPVVSSESEPLTGKRLAALLTVGAVGGLMSGMLGVGGGIVMVPLMLWLLKFDQRRAAATSLAVIVLASASGAISYLLAEHVDLVAAALMAVGGIIGTQLGTRLLRALPLGVLRWGFIALLVLIAIRMMFAVSERGGELELTQQAIAGLIVSGLIMGVLAGLFGIGGGVLIVPILVTLFGSSDLVAKGTSLWAMIAISISGSIANVRAKMFRPLDALLMGVAAAIMAIVGAAVAFAIPAGLGNALFAVFVLATALQMTVKALRARPRRAG